MNTAVVFAMAATLLAGLRNTYADLFVRIKELAQYLSPDIQRQVRAQVEGATARMTMVADGTAERLDALANAARDADQFKRRFQADAQVLRDLKTPDKLITSFLIMLGWLVETIFTTISLVADGHLDLIPAMGFAATFSTVTVGLGIAAGACLRYVLYRSQNPLQRPIYRKVRRFGRAGLDFVLIIAFLMIFVGGRVRVTGGHENIFEFSDVSFAATFDDGLALVIMVAAGLSFAMSVVKGYSGFSDPVVGYEDHAGRQAAGIDDDAANIADNAVDVVGEILADAEDDIADLLEPSNDLFDLQAAIAAYNADVLNAKDEVRVFAEEERERQEFASGHRLPPDAMNLEPFDKLLIDPDALPEPQALSEELDALRQAHLDASTRITTALATYYAQVRATSLAPPAS